jgi:protein-tyrosine-phosphatase
MAHAIFVAEAKKRSLPIEVYSAGVINFGDAPPIADTLATCLQYETPSPKEVPTWVPDLPLDSITRFLVMESYHLECLVRNYGVTRSRISLLGEFDPERRGAEIDDPYGCGSAIYEQSYKRIRDCIINYLDTNHELR